MGKRWIGIAMVFAFLLLLGCGQRYPVIYAPDARISVGETYDADDGVHALDAVDGDITSHVKVTRGKLDVQKAGRYRICYSVTNSRGFSARACRIITVSPVSRTLWRAVVVLCAVGAAALLSCILLWKIGRTKGRETIEIPEY